MREVFGRKEIVDSLTAQALAGHTVLVFGPLGIGKTAILQEVVRRAAEAGRAHAYAARTAAMQDVTRALAEAYPAVSARAGSQRQLRSRLLLAVEERPGILILDHVQRAGTALKGLLRTLDGTGLAILIAADVEHARDHARVRAMRLAYREQHVPPLHGRHMNLILDAHLAQRPLPHPLTEVDRSSLLRIAAGRPGVIHMLLERLEMDRYWRDGQVLSEILRSDVSMAIAEAYIREVNSRTRGAHK